MPVSSVSMKSLKRSLRRSIRRIPGRRHERMLRDVPFTVISDTCWGAQFYKHVRRTYNTPFIGLGIDPPDYIRFLGDVEGYLNRELELSGIYAVPRPDGVHWPLGRLGDVEVQLYHYESFAAARDAWNRRVERIDLDNLHIVFHASRRRAKPADLEPFLALPHERKVAFTREPRAGAVTVPAWCNNGAELFRRSQRVFDAVAWVAGEDPAPRRRDALCFAAGSDPHNAGWM
jgi:uncharacterized protein (DUF1919 family)